MAKIALAWVPMAGAIPAEFLEVIPVFQVAPLSEGLVPLDMNTGDVRGDLYFYLGGHVDAVECQNDPEHCTRNVERTAPDLAITKLLLEVDNRYGKYSRCNVCLCDERGCTDNGHGAVGCTEGEYVCTCAERINGTYPPTLSCGAPVGRRNLFEDKGNDDCDEDDSETDCWYDHIGAKMGGYWYSTVSDGYCGDGSYPEPEGCTWRVKEITKSVNASCADHMIHSDVEMWEIHNDADYCFSKCEDSGMGHERNYSSPCWARCFYEALLGPDGGKPGWSKSDSRQLPTQLLVDSWNRVFNSFEEGSWCPDIQHKAPKAAPMVV